MKLLLFSLTLLQFCDQHWPQRDRHHHAHQPPLQRARRRERGRLQLLPGWRLVRGGPPGRLPFQSGRGVQGEASPPGFIPRRVRLGLSQALISIMMRFVLSSVLHMAELEKGAKVSIVNFFYMD